MRPSKACGTSGFLLVYVSRGSSPRRERPPCSLQYYHRSRNAILCSYSIKRCAGQRACSQRFFFQKFPSLCRSFTHQNLLLVPQLFPLPLSVFPPCFRVSPSSFSVELLLHRKGVELHHPLLPLSIIQKASQLLTQEHSQRTLWRQCSTHHADQRIIQTSHEMSKCGEIISQY